MPVPRIFDAQFDPREHWVHVLATLLGLAGPQTRTALVEEITGEELPEADAMHVREQRPLKGEGNRFTDIVARGAGWTLAVHANLAFDADESENLGATWDALDELADKTILVHVSPDRKPPAAVLEAQQGGRDVRHRSWLRIRDWVQERPERGRAEGIDLLLLREAEYFLTPRVAELYRLESLMPLVGPELRPALASMFFALNDMAPAPMIQTQGSDEALVTYPRTGDAGVQIAISDGALALRLRTAEEGPGTVADEGGWRRLDVTSDDVWLSARSWTRGVARAVLPPRR
jgi:hypothetical protein